ncbi:MAG: cytochrome C [Planctomycetota bacterium]
MKLVAWLLGPRVSREDLAERRWHYRLPTLLLTLAAISLLVALFQPVWKMTLQAPQYPKGLHVRAYVTHLVGDVEEIDRLNHYIGMRPLGEAAQLERRVGTYAIVVLSMLVLGAVFVHTKWAALLALPAFTFPFVFLADLSYWMHDFGTNLDPRAPLSQSIKPFVPPVLGTGVIGNFKTIAWVDVGFYFALLASLLIMVGLFFHRRAYKPLVDALEAESGAAPAEDSVTSAQAV